MPEMNSETEFIGRLRINEARIAGLRERLIVTDNNMIEEFRRVSEQMQDLNSELRQVRNEMFKTRETLKEVVKEMGSFASSQELKVLERYINTWNPLNFMTEKEVLSLIKENARPSNKDK
ncbi:hypothetical protein HYV89_03575 [Candidatus Woesearchaeota archaeon]|nr:hypothetical protein [Candidatus Woesearchaeota archaeon]